MSATSQDALPLLCELGWHRPDQLARWNDGYYFSKCSRCGRDLVRTAYGSWQLPKGFRVVWQPKAPETRERIALLPAGGAEVASPLQDDLGFPIADVAPSQPIKTEQEEPETARAADTAVAQSPTVAEQARRIEEPVPMPEPRQAAAPAPEAEDEPVDAAVDQPAAQPGQSDKPAAAQDDAAGQPVPTDQPTAVEEPDAAGAASLPGTEFPIEELLQQPNGTAHVVEQQSSAREEESAPAAEPAPPAARDGRKELPIEEVLRHLNATPLPEPELEAEPKPQTADQAEPQPEPQAEDEPDPQPEPEPEPGPEPQSGPASEAEPQSEPEAPALAEERAAAAGQIEEPAHEGLSAEEVPDPAAAAVEAIEPEAAEPSGQLDEPTAEESEPPAAELPFEPALPARGPPRAIVEPSTDWDFMAEEEEDPIGTFWDDLARPAPGEAMAGEDAIGPAGGPPQEPAPDETAGEAIDEEPPESAFASSREEVPAIVSEPLGERQAEPNAVAPPEERIHPASAAQPPAAPVAPPPLPRWLDPEAEAVAQEPEWPEPVAATPQAGRAPAAAAQPKQPVERAEPAGRRAEPAQSTAEPDDLPPWVDAADEDVGADAERSRSSRFAVTAVASVGVLALAAALAGRPDTSPTANPRQQAAPTTAQAPAAAPAARARVTPGREATGRAATATTPFAKREPGFVSPGRPAVPMALPTLPARELAFVSASVLQCRSAPVERSPAVRKLVRGAQVQILAREGNWISVAHKGRQCWAASRFLSAAQPW